MTKIIQVSKDLCNLVQKANLERNSRRDLLLYIMQNQLNISQEKLQQYQEEYDEKYSNFEKLKLIIENKYVKPIVSPNENYSWSLDYYTCEITVNIDEIT